MKSLLLLAFCFVVSLADAQDLHQRYKAASEKTNIEACANIETYGFYPQTCNGLDFHEYVKKNFKPVINSDDWIKLHLLLTFNCDGQIGNLRMEYEASTKITYEVPYTNEGIGLYEQFASFVDTLHCAPDNEATLRLYLLYVSSEKKLTIN